MHLRQLLAEVRIYNKKDISKIMYAYKLASEIHKTHKRASGEPFIQHPLNVAYILAKLRMDTSTIIAGLLHDSVEDSNITMENIRKIFGDEISSLVDGVTKLTELKVKNIEEHEAENIRKMLMASTKDIRVIIIKLADKLHNMRTIGYLTKEQQQRICKETINIYAPLAYRLGMASIKWELEDLSFKYLEPEMYQKFKEKFGKKRSQREQEIRSIMRFVEKELKSHGLKHRILGRPKHFYSIYKKMVTKHRTFEELHDLIGLRIIVNGIKDCYEALGIIHNLWKPIPGEFIDYIAMPKENFYQSLHTAVIALNQVVEFQIRTEEMDNIAEEGIAAHWKYKGVYGAESFDKKLSWLRQILDWQKEAGSTKEFMDYLQVDFFEDEIYVFTPKGKVVPLSKGSCPIDFAYSVHTSIGERCVGAVVNGRIVPLRYELKNGDIVNIITSKTANPKRDWLKIVKTTKAKSKIVKFIKESQKIPIGSLAKKKPLLAEDEISMVDIPDVTRPNLRFARCCRPVPGDEVIAYSTGSNKYSIHVLGCNEITSKRRERMFAASWKEKSLFKTTIKVLAYDRVGMFADILNTVASTGTNVNAAKAKTIGDNIVECSLNIMPEGIDHLKDIIMRIKRIRNIKHVYLADP